MAHQRSNLGNHVAVVAGGSGGIGGCVCRMLRENGAAVVSIRHRSNRIAGATNGVTNLQADLGSFAEWSRVIRIVLKRFGTIDSLIHCSGVLIPGTASTLSEEQIHTILEVNILSFIYGCRAVLPIMRSRRKGSIVAIGSLGGVLPMPYEPIYCATKFGLRGFSLSLNEELRETGVHCSLISAGPVKTRMLDAEAMDRDSVIAFMTRPLRPERVAAVVLSLLNHPKPEVLVPRPAGFSSRLLAFTPRLFGLVFRLLAPYGERMRNKYLHDHVVASKGWDK